MNFVHVFGVDVDIDFIFFLLSIISALAICVKIIVSKNVFNHKNNDDNEIKLPCCDNKIEPTYLTDYTCDCTDHSLNQILLNPIYSHIPANIFHHLTNWPEE